MARLVCLAFALCACSGSDPTGPNAVSGSVAGHEWNQVASAWWIGLPSAGSPPVILFLIESPKSCQDISAANWDKIIGTTQVLEISLPEAAARSFAAPTEATESYLRDNYNPDVTGGHVTITAVHAGQNITGSFDAVFGSDDIQGHFDATFCPTGVEP